MGVDLKNLESCSVSELVVLVKQRVQRVETLEAENSSLKDEVRASKRGSTTPDPLLGRDTVPLVPTTAATTANM